MRSEQKRIESVFKVNCGGAYSEVEIIFLDQNWLSHSYLLRLDIIDESNTDVQLCYLTNNLMNFWQCVSNLQNKLVFNQALHLHQQRRSQLFNLIIQHFHLRVDQLHRLVRCFYLVVFKLLFNRPELINRQLETPSMTMSIIGVRKFVNSTSYIKIFKTSD